MMPLRVNNYPNRLTAITKQLSARMLSSLCGIDHEIGFMLGASHEAKMIVAGAELTGVHTLLNLPKPGRGAYHLGGCGIRLNEALIRTLGETVERYAQLVAEISGLSESCFTSYRQLCARSEPVIELNKLQYFSEIQYLDRSFPFQAFDQDTPLTWVKVMSLITKNKIWVPAQHLLVGYQIKREQGEPWMSAAVTTGTAAHTDPEQALLSAIIEMIQIDAAMGHWYSGQAAPQIILDDRTLPLKNLLDKFNPFGKSLFTFHWLQSPDMPCFTIACVYRGANMQIPRVTVGLGASHELNDAMYKAYLEAVGIMGLARMLVFEKKYASLTDNHEQKFYDLDSNVAAYALGESLAVIDDKFPMQYCVAAKNMPCDYDENKNELLSNIITCCAKNDIDLYYLDLTTREASDLGFVVPRVWSPDLLSLCLPSAPFLNHPRYKLYGNISHETPHPYP